MSGTRDDLRIVPPLEPGNVTMMCRDAVGMEFRPVRIAGARFRIGRRAENDLIIANASVSRQHAEFLFENGRWFVTDNDSKFGTFVNGERVVRAPVSHGDEIRLGGDDGPLIVFGVVGQPAGTPFVADDTAEPPTTGRGMPPVRRQGESVDPGDAAMRLVERFRATSLIGDYREALTIVVDAALQLTQFDFSALCLVDDEDADSSGVRTEVARTASGASGAPNSARVARFVIDAASVGTVLLLPSESPPGDGGSDTFRTARAAGVRQVVCVPIAASAGRPESDASPPRMIGGLYLEDTSGAPTVTTRVRDALASLAAEAGGVLERMNAHQLEIGRVRERLARAASEDAVRASDTSLAMVDRARAACALAEYLLVVGDIDAAQAALEEFYETSQRSALPDVDRAALLRTLGKAHMWRARWHRAVGILNSALDALGDNQNLQIEMETRSLLARCYCEIGELGLAREFVLKALTSLRREDDTSAAYSTSLMVAGVIAERDGDLASAAHAFREALRIADATSNLSIAIAANYRLGRVHFARGDTDEAKTSFQRMLELAHPMGNGIELSLGQAALAAGLVRAGAWRRADAVISAGIATATRAGRDDALGQLLILAATIAAHRDGGAAADAAILALREFAERTQNARAVTETDLLEADLLLSSGETDAARQMLIAAISRERDSDDPVTIARLHLMHAEAERQSGDLAAAEACVRRSHDAIADTRDLMVAGLAQRATGRIHADAGRHTEAQHSLAQSLSIFRTVDDRRLIGLTHLDIGNLMLAASDPACARTHLRQASDIFGELDIRALRMAAESGLQSAMAQGGVSSSASYSSIVLGARSEPRFVRRLLEAAQSRELLLCELTSIALDVSLATSAVAAGCSADAGVAVLASSGANPSGGLPVAGLLEAARGQIVRTNAVAIYSVEQASSAGSAGIATVLFVNVPVSSGSRADTALKLVVQLARQGLELVSLRTPARRDGTIHDDPLVRTRSAAVDPDADILLYESAGMRQLADRLQRIRTSSSTVLITGESGVGKELVARAIHATIPRPRAPFVPFNCSAAPRDLIESQIFGHRKGAFTGATSDNPGLARSAKGGTLFLDEIGDLPLELQPKFLRFLESGEILPLGATAPMHVDARVVAATNADLEELVATRKFREDLYHRLNIIRLHVPPLRDRREDIPLLAGHFLSRLSTRAGRATPSRLSKEALAALVAYPWPGNVRQLRNEIERSVTFGAEGVEITLEHLSDEIRMAVDRDKANPWTRGDGHTSTDVLTERLRQYEIDEIRRALAASGMNLTRAATRLGMARQNLQRRMRKLGLTAGDF